MSAIERLTVTMPVEMAARVRAIVETGDYASASEVVREALREWSRRRDAEQRDLEALRDAVRFGDTSGPGIPAETLFQELRDRIRQRRDDAA